VRPTRVTKKRVEENGKRGWWVEESKDRGEESRKDGEKGEKGDNEGRRDK
jgi:hypothetical protein